MVDPFWSTLHQALSSGARSTVLKPLGWLTALMLVGSIGSFRFGAPPWFAGTLAALCIATVILYLVAYVYFALTDKDSLRSEKYSIQKLAIQKGFLGDDKSGYIPITLSHETQPVVPTLSDQEKGSGESR